MSCYTGGTSGKASSDGRGDRMTTRAISYPGVRLGLEAGFFFEKSGGTDAADDT